MSASRPGATPFEERYFRKGLGLRGEVREAVAYEYRSDWVQALRENDHTLAVGSTTLLLARAFGFCYGVERSVDYAYETVRRFPDRRIVLTGEIIHNPRVNDRLRELGVAFLGDAGVPDLDALGPEDVVILPAFGVARGPFAALRQSGAVVVDTTCGSVLNVWKNVERYARDGLTSLVHGKVGHEETTATVSRAGLYENGHYAVVLDLDEAERIAAFIRTGEGGDALRRHLAPPRTSPGFDPTLHLQRIGVANQTTMLSSESLAIAQRIREALAARYGDAEDPSRFRSFDTICSATQDRQEALAALLDDRLDLLLVIGGFNSSNTGHLAEMAGGRVPAFHVEGPEDLAGPTAIRHKPVGGAPVRAEVPWLPAAGAARIGLTSGASTPDALVGAVIDRLLALRGDLPAPGPKAPG